MMSKMCIRDRFCLEGNVRYASILGYVGAGGLGLIMNEKIGWREYDSLGIVTTPFVQLVEPSTRMTTCLV